MTREESIENLIIDVEFRDYLKNIEKEYRNSRIGIEAKTSLIYIKNKINLSIIEHKAQYKEKLDVSLIDNLSL